MSETPIGCRMDALTPAERNRRRELLEGLRARALGVAETADGIAFRLPGDRDVPVLVAEFVTYESRCCPFLRFEMAVDAEGGPVHLRMGGRAGVKDFLRAEFLATS
jgi:hypothetical protein